MVYPTAEDPRPAVAVAGPFTLRDLFVVGGGAIVLLGSILPFQVPNGMTFNVWSLNGMLFNHLVSLGLPLVVAGAFAWRRLTGRTRVVVGSLTLDQIASVVAVLTALYFFISTVLSVHVAFVLGLLGALVMLAGTTAASVVPGFAQDFAAGEGHVLGRPVRPTPHGTGQAAQDGPLPGEQPAAAGMGEAALAGQAGSVEGFTRPAPGSGAQGPSAAGEDDGGASPATETAADVQSPAAARSVAATQAAESTADTAAPAPSPTEAQQSPAAASGAAAAGGTAAGPGQAAGSTGPGSPRAQEAADGSAPDVELAGAGAKAARGTDTGPEEPSGQATTALPAAQPEPEPEETSFEASRSEGTDYQAFWFAVPQTRQIIDENTGNPVFTVEPGSWILALEDRGDEFLVQDTDGRIGVLRDLTNIERA